MADVQMYRFNGSAWVEVNPVPAAHDHNSLYNTKTEIASLLADKLNKVTTGSHTRLYAVNGSNEQTMQYYSTGTTAWEIPQRKANGIIRNVTGNTASRPTTSLNAGDLYFNTELGNLQVYNGTTWVNLEPNNKWKQIYTGTSAEALSKTTTTSITVPSDTYAGKTIAVEIRYGSASYNSYTNRIVLVTLGTNSSTTASKTYPRFISFSEWDGTYLKNISTKCYVTTTSSTTSIIFGYLKTLIGQFTGTTINWTTEANDSLNVYIGKIWLVG